jgi:hypothetical protein
LPFGIGALVGPVSYLTWDVMGQTSAHSRLCPGPTDCDISYGMGAVLLAVAASIGLGIVGGAAFAVKELALRRKGV